LSISDWRRPFRRFTVHTARYEIPCHSKVSSSNISGIGEAPNEFFIIRLEHPVIIPVLPEFWNGFLESDFRKRKVSVEKNKGK
jgi:hypothetical protein